MFDQILSLLKEKVGPEILAKTGISPDKLDDVLAVAGKSAASTASKEMLSGGVGSLMNLFSDKPNNAAASSLQNNMVGGVVSSLIEKLGLNKDMANTVANMVVPAVIAFVTKKNNATPDGDSSPLEAIFGGGNAGGLGGMLGKLGGLFGK